MIKVIRQNGNELMCLCPFPEHNDTKPSLGLNLDKNIYYCFGCKRGGKAKDLIDRFGNPSFYSFDDEYSPISDDGSTPMEPDSNTESGIDYMKFRGFTEETLDTFYVSYNPKTYRIVIPILDRFNRVIGTIGRTIANEEPRYKYSRNLKVRNTLFGLHTCVSIPEEVIYLTEGSIDAMWLWQNGYRPALAVLGSSLSDEQSRIIAKLGKSVVLCFDNDDAGRKVSREAFKKLHNMGMIVHNIKLPYNKKDVQDCSNNELSEIMSRTKMYLLV